MSLRPAPAARTDAALVLARPSSRIDTLLRIGDLHLETTGARKLTPEQTVYLRNKYDRPGQPKWWQVDEATVAKRKEEAKAAVPKKEEAQNKAARQGATEKARGKQPAQQPAVEDGLPKLSDKDREEAPEWLYDLLVDGKVIAPSPMPGGSKPTAKTYYLLCMGGEDHVTMRQKITEKHFLDISNRDPAWTAYHNSRVEVHAGDRDKQLEYLASTAGGEWDVKPRTDYGPHVLVNRHYGELPEDVDRIFVQVGFPTEREPFEEFGADKANKAIEKITRNHWDNWGKRTIAIEWEIWKHVTRGNRMAFLQRTKATEIHLIINDFISYGNKIDVAG